MRDTAGHEVWSKATTAAAVMLGDSLTDGRGSTTNGNNRWPDQLLQRLQASPANPRQLLPAADVGDHLHLNPAGYKLLADTVPARLFS
jgi:lysophospholipase L1-like esterase